MRHRHLASLLLCLLAGGCKLDREPVAAGRDQLVVHAVLNPAPQHQLILLERTLTGRAAIDTTLHYDSLDAVVSRGGIPVSGATVVVVGADGDSAVALEDAVRRTDGRGRGMYRFENVQRDPEPGDTSLHVVPGGRYELHITTADGATVRGTTVVPGAQPVPPATTFVPFDRDEDSVFVWWDDVPQAARYQLRIESPRGPFHLFVDSTEYLIAGGLRNTDVGGLPNVFFPGFVQQVTIGAVDRNFYDYYRTANDPFTGSGLVTHLDGALGVFGSYVMIRSSQLTVIAPDTNELIEGPYHRLSASYAGAPEIVQLYTESASGQTTRLSGNWRNGSTGFPPPGVLGTFDGFHVTLALLRGQSARDTAAVIDAHYVPQTRTIIGTDRATGSAVQFRHAP